MRALRSVIPLLAIMLMSPSATVSAQEDGQSSLHQIKSQLAAEQKKGQKPDTITLNDGNVLHGQIVEETDDRVVIKVPLGALGSLERKIPKSRIASLEHGEAERVRVTDEEAEIRRELPWFKMIRRGPYTFFTDQDFKLIETMVLNLQRLRKEYVRELGSVFEVWDPEQTAYVLVFGDENLYEEYAREALAQAEFTAGFYSPKDHRLVLYNHLGSTGFKDFQDRLDELHQQGRRVRDDAGTRAALEMKQQNQRVIRHEGVHQLCDLSGLFMGPFGQQMWLAEGLATYFETPRAGEQDETLMQLLRNARQQGTLYPLQQVVSQDDLFASRDPERLRLAYAQAWSFTRFLLIGSYRVHFLDYLRSINLGKQAPSRLREERWRKLTEFLRVEFSVLESQWLKSLEL